MIVHTALLLQETFVSVANAREMKSFLSSNMVSLTAEKLNTVTSLWPTLLQYSNKYSDKYDKCSKFIFKTYKNIGIFIFDSLEFRHNLLDLRILNSMIF